MPKYTIVYFAIHKCLTKKSYIHLKGDNGKSFYRKRSQVIVNAEM